MTEFENFQIVPTVTECYVSFQTTEESDPMLNWGTTTAYGTAEPPKGTTATVHEFNISGLQATTEYHFEARDATSASQDQTFTTLTTVAPVEEEKYDVRQLQLQSEAIFDVPHFVAAGAVSAASLEGLVTKTQMQEAIDAFLEGGV